MILDSSEGVEDEDFTSALDDAFAKSSELDLGDFSAKSIVNLLLEAVSIMVRLPLIFCANVFVLTFAFVCLN